MKETRDRDPIESAYASVIARGVVLAAGTTSDPEEAGIYFCSLQWKSWNWNR